MIDFLHPEAFLLAAPALWLLVRGVARRRGVVALRIGLLLCALAVLAGPRTVGADHGRDVIFLVDRSRSMPETARKAFEELAVRAAETREPGDRIGLVAFGREAVVEVEPRERFVYAAPTKALDRNATDIKKAIELGLSLVAPGRRASLVLVSDGEATGMDAKSAAMDALRSGVRIDAFAMRRSGRFDVAVEELNPPSQVGRGEVFQFSAWVRADRPGEGNVRLLRDGVEIAHGTRTLRAGLNRLLFRDVLKEPGVHRYEVTVEAGDDPVRENDRARAIVRAVGPRRVLCVTPAGRRDRLTESLRAAGLEVVVAAPLVAPLRLDALDGFRSVVLENVAASDLPSGSLAALAFWVRRLGGGLLMTGGKASFGSGGYYRSQVEAVLPVSLEIREEQRQFGVAMAIALDRSGSMARTTADGRTKMDLANLGAAAAVELLGRIDSVAVLAVDSGAHLAVPLTPVKDVRSLSDSIRAIRSAGGGIYVHAALVAAAAELAKARQTTKHIVLFADAADAEQPGDYETFVPKLVRAGVTVSVIGLGSPSDSDAELLRNVAKLGGGRCTFVASAAELPRVFAEETIQVARSSMVEEPTDVAMAAGLLGISALARTKFPRVGGYSIAYLRRGAQLGAATRDEQKAPMFAFWQHGLGRAASFLGEVDGALSGGLRSWDGFGEFFATVVGWLCGTEATGEVFTEFRRQGHEAVLSIEVGAEARLDDIRARVFDARGRGTNVSLQRTGATRLEARIPLVGDRALRAVVSVGSGEVLRLPPVTLPYSSEFEHRLDPASGERTLRRLTELTGGKLDPKVGTLFRGSRAGFGTRDLTWLFALLAILLLLAEIAVRRLVEQAPPRVAKPRPPRTRPEPTPEVADDITSVLDRARARDRRAK